MRHMLCLAHFFRRSAPPTRPKSVYDAPCAVSRERTSSVGKKRGSSFFGYNQSGGRGGGGARACGGCDAFLTNRGPVGDDERGPVRSK